MNKATKAVLITLAIFALIVIVASTAATLAAVGTVIIGYVVKAVAFGAIVASPVKLLPMLAALV